MKRVISFLGKNLFVVGLVSLISLSGAFCFAVQPGYAVNTSTQERVSHSAMTDQAPEQAYEQMAKDARDTINNPQALDEEYDRDKKARKQEQGGLVEGAKKALEKVTKSDE